MIRGSTESARTESARREKRAKGKAREGKSARTEKRRKGRSPDVIIESTGTLDAEHAFALIAVALLVVEVDDDQVALAASGRPCDPVLA